jgi:hypothetical protein
MVATCSHPRPDGHPRPAGVVRVDVAERFLVASPPGQHGGNLQALQQGRQRIVLVHGDEQDAVDPARRQIGRKSIPLAPVADQDEQQLHIGLGEFRRDAADDVGEVGLGEEPGLGLGDDQRDGVGPRRDEGAGGPVGDVAEFGDGRLDGLAGPVADPGRAVDHARDGAAADTGERGHLLQGRACRAPRIRPGVARPGGALCGLAHRSPRGEIILGRALSPGCCSLLFAVSGLHCVRFPCAGSHPGGSGPRGLRFRVAVGPAGTPGPWWPEGLPERRFARIRPRVLTLAPTTKEPFGMHDGSAPTL